ncbi:hypothetical protein RUM44_010341 [Polyplax serrata]|uniref:Uncharacterized protein n=1 Tax=Polyplax serrata TaxID=468196 RepID=A0ABR1AVX2_POLSC
MKILFIRKGDVTGVPRKKLKSAHFELPEFSSETTLEKSALRFLLSLCQVGQRGANILGGPGRHLFEIGEKTQEEVNVLHRKNMKEVESGRAALPPGQQV